MIPKPVANVAQRLNYNALCIILAYMLRMNELNEHLQEDLEYILSKATYLIEMMLMVGNVLQKEFMMRNIKKRIPAKTINTLIQFSQNIVQGMWADDDPFLQLPFVDYERLKNFRKKNKNITLESYCKLTKEDRKALGMYENPQEFEESERAVGSFPVITAESQHMVEGETDVAVGDILTIKLIITH